MGSSSTVPARRVESGERRLRLVLAADAGWDAVIGVALCLAIWTSAADAVGLPTARPAALFLILGLGCVGFAVFLARAARGIDTLPVARAAAIGNAAAVIAIIAVLIAADEPPGRVVVLFGAAGVGCAVFAALEASAVRR